MNAPRSRRQFLRGLPVPLTLALIPTLTLTLTGAVAFPARLAAATPSESGENDPLRWVAAARRQIGVTESYDPAYRKLAYPGGDVPRQTGVCSDVVVRAFRELGLDLQKELHEDMKRDFRAYPQKWGLKKPDPNIDHRRVPNLMAYFRRRGWERTVADPAPKTAPTARDGTGFAAGDIVAWDLGGGITHIGVLSDRRSAAGVPLVIHNIGNGAREEDVLRQYRILGQYRPRLRS